MDHLDKSRRDHLQALELIPVVPAVPCQQTVRLQTGVRPDEEVRQHG